MNSEFTFYRKLFATAAKSNILLASKCKKSLISSNSLFESCKHLFSVSVSCWKFTLLSHNLERQGIVQILRDQQNTDFDPTHPCNQACKEDFLNLYGA